MRKVLKLVMFDLKRNKIQYLVILINALAMLLCFRHCFSTFHGILCDNRIEYHGVYDIGLSDFDSCNNKKEVWDNLVHDKNIKNIAVDLSFNGIPESSDDIIESYFASPYFPNAYDKFNPKIKKKMIFGRLFTQKEINTEQKVAIVDKLVFEANGKKKKLKIYNSEFEIVGVADLKECSCNNILVPFNFKEKEVDICDMNVYVDSANYNKIFRKVNKLRKSYFQDETKIINDYEQDRIDETIKVSIIGIMLLIVFAVSVLNYRNIYVIFKKQNSKINEIYFRVGINKKVRILTSLVVKVILATGLVFSGYFVWRL